MHRELIRDGKQVTADTKVQVIETIRQKQPKGLKKTQNNNDGRNSTREAQTDYKNKAISPN